MRKRMLPVVLCLVVSAVAFGADVVNPFFPYCIDTHDSKHRSLEEQAAMLKELGFDGMGHLWLDNIPERLATLDAVGLKLFQISIRVDIKAEKDAYDARLKDVVPLLKGRGVMINLLMTGLPPSDQAGDARAVELVREIADLCRDAGVRVVLYPHAGDWLERVEDGLRIVKKAERPNVGVMFNLCHWLKVDKEENLRPLLKQAMPHLMAVSINGADGAEAIRAGTGNWLQPLDQGSYDVGALLAVLRALGYTGPVGLQCWGIEGDVREHLARSMAAWRKMNGLPEMP